MFVNCGLISLVYPFLVFGYALVEETRPRKEFWILVRRYTLCLMMIKFVLNLSVFDELVGTNEFKYWNSLL
jgi:hypothetical protein